MVMFFGISCKKNTPTCKTCGWANTQGGDIVEGSQQLCGDAITEWEAKEYPQSATTSTVKSVTKFAVCK